MPTPINVSDCSIVDATAMGGVNDTVFIKRTIRHKPAAAALLMPTNVSLGLPNTYMETRTHYLVSSNLSCSSRESGEKEKAYNMPKLKLPAIIIFSRLGLCKFHTITHGKIAKHKSTRIVVTAFANKVD